MSDSSIFGISALALLIPILIVAMNVAAVIVWILVWHRRRVHEFDCRHKERMAAIEKGRRRRLSYLLLRGRAQGDSLGARDAAVRERSVSIKKRERTPANIS